MGTIDLVIVVLFFCWLLFWTGWGAWTAFRGLLDGELLGFGIAAAMMGVGAIALIGLWPWRHLLWRRRDVEGHGFPIIPAKTKETKD